MLQSELKVGDSVLVISGTCTAEMLGFIGKVLTIKKIDSTAPTLHFYVQYGQFTCWVDGIQPTELLKTLI